MEANSRLFNSRKTTRSWFPGEALSYAVSGSGGVVLARFSHLHDAKQFEALPELLQALILVRDDILPEYLSEHPGSYRAVGALHDAIAKATQQRLAGQGQKERKMG